MVQKPLERRKLKPGLSRGMRGPYHGVRPPWLGSTLKTAPRRSACADGGQRKRHPSPRVGLAALAPQRLARVWQARVAPGAFSVCLSSVEGKKNLSAQSPGARVAKYELAGQHVAPYSFSRGVTVAQPSTSSRLGTYSGNEQLCLSDMCFSVALPARRLTVAAILPAGRLGARTPVESGAAIAPSLRLGGWEPASPK